jgi:LPS-assembly lipoprotein
MAVQRRSLLAMLALPVALATLAGCGFKLRTSQPLPFSTIAVTPEKSGGVAGDLARYLGDIVRPMAPGAGGELPEVILDILQEVREKLVVGVNASGQVREFELRMRVNFKLRTAKGVELIAPSVIEQHRSISFNESAVLAKEAEEVLLYRDMQADIVQQLLRRLGAVKMPGQASALPAAPVPPLPSPAPE